MTTLLIICALAALGLLTASNAVLEKLPSAKGVISFIRPFEEIVGVCSFLLGAWLFFWWGIRIINVLNIFSPTYLFNMFSYMVMIGLGAYLSKGTLSRILPFAANLIERITAFVTSKGQLIGIIALVLAAIHLFFLLT